MLSLIVLLTPWMMLLLISTTTIFLIKKKWKNAVCLAVITLLLNWWSDCFCFGFKHTFEGDLKVLSFNLNGGGEYDGEKTKAILCVIKDEEPDVVFMTENFSPMCDSLHERLQQEYPYDTRKMNHNVIYSRYPLRSLLFFQMINQGTSYLVKCVADVNGKDVALFGCHLSSNNYSKRKDYLTPDMVRSPSGIKEYFENFSHATQLREMEADTVIHHCQSTERVVIMGDLNDVSGTTTLRIFEHAGYHNAWSEGGLGIGATIRKPLPYRIDHVLYNNGLKLKGIKKIDTQGISDHDALVAVFDIL